MFVLIVVISFSWGVAVLPNSKNEQWVANKVVSTAKWVYHQVDKISSPGEAYKNDDGLIEFIRPWLSKSSTYIFYAKQIQDGNRYFRLTEYLFDESIFHRNLRLREKLLIANELKPADIANLKESNTKINKGILRKIVGLDLKGRDLRYADFSGSLMPKVDFRELRWSYNQTYRCEFSGCHII